MFYVPTPVSDDTSEELTETDTLSVSSLNDYETDLQRLCKNEIHFIRTYSLAGNLRLSKVRSIYWRLLLGILPESSLGWITSIRELRDQYNDIKTSFTVDPRSSLGIPDDNPLSLDRNSVWNKYFCDQELKRFIRLDVTRTSADRNFFQVPHIHDRLVDILFFYARQNPDICYRQGMHELLTPIVSVLHADCDNFAKEKQDTVMNSTLTEILDLDYLDHDAFSLFSCVMKRMKKFYEVEGVPNSSGYFPPLSCLKESINKNRLESMYENAIISHLHELQDELRKHDILLHDHLKALNINYSVFGIRWLRLLFGREFPFEYLIILWDAIFAINTDLALVKYISLALLIIQRHELLVSDEVDCLKHLMKCPCSIDVMLVINYALYLKDPNAYQKPILPIFSDEDSIQENAGAQYICEESAANSKNRKNTTWTKILKNKKAIDLKNASNINQFNVVDDFSPRSFAMLVSEVKHMRLVMSLCKIKLMQYHDLLSGSVSINDVAAMRALEGIDEICQFLDVDHFSLKSTHSTDPLEVETAHEAEEVIISPTTQLSHSYSNPTLDVVATFLPPPNSDCDMELFKYCEMESTDSSKFPPENPIRGHL